jgi:hypothetical protein
MRGTACIRRPPQPHTAWRSFCEIFATLGKYFVAVTLASGFFGFDVANVQQVLGGVRMSIESLLLILVLTFAAGFVLDRLDLKRKL